MIVTPSGLFHVPCVFGALVVPEVLVGVGVGLGFGEGDGEGEGEGDGDGLGVGDGETVATVKLVLAVPALPAASVARAVTVCAPAATFDSDRLQLLVPPAGCQAPPSSDTATALTPTSSDAVPATVSVAAVVLPEVGVEMARAGAVVSAAVRVRRGLPAA
jgi:hypothetical protein